MTAPDDHGTRERHVDAYMFRWLGDHQVGSVQWQRSANPRRMWLRGVIKPEVYRGSRFLYRVITLWPFQRVSVHSLDRVFR